MEVYDGCLRLPQTKEGVAKDGPTKGSRRRAEALGLDGRHSSHQHFLGVDKGELL